MNPGLNEINSLIEQCDRMIDFINQYGIIHTGNLQYEEYKKQIIRFFNARNDIRYDYGPYLVLDKLHYSGGGYTVCMSEMQMIRNTLIWMKHRNRVRIYYADGRDLLFLCTYSRNKTLFMLYA